jgi:hypothetical protein
MLIFGGETASLFRGQIPSSPLHGSMFSRRTGVSLTSVNYVLITPAASAAVSTNIGKPPDLRGLGFGNVRLAGTERHCDRSGGSWSVLGATEIAVEDPGDRVAGDVLESGVHGE